MARRPLLLLLGSLVGCESAPPGADAASGPIDAAAAVDAAVPDAHAAADAAPGAVSGRVVDRRLEGMPGLKVLVAGTQVQTDGDGRFMATATPPYQLIVLDDTDANERLVIVYEGVTRADPLVKLQPHAEEADGGWQHSATLDLPVPAFSMPGIARVAVAKVSGASVDGYHVMTTTLRFDGLSWNGGTQATANIHQLWVERTGAGDLWTDVIGRGDATAAVVDGMPNMAAPMTVFTVDSGMVTVTSTAPAGYGVPSVATGVVFADGAYVHSGAANASASFAIPDAVDVTAIASIYAGDGAGGYTSAVVPGLVPGAMEDVTLPTPPTMLAPGPGTTVSPGTLFTWTPGTGGVSVMTLANEPMPTSVKYVIHTGDTNVSLPDLAPIGAELPAATPIYWHVGMIGPATSTDELLDPATVESGTRPPTRPSFSTMTPARTLSYQP